MKQYEGPLLHELPCPFPFVGCCDGHFGVVETIYRCVLERHSDELEVKYLCLDCLTAADVSDRPSLLFSRPVIFLDNFAVEVEEIADFNGRLIRVRIPTRPLTETPTG